MSDGFCIHESYTSNIYDPAVLCENTVVEGEDFCVWHVDD